MAETPECRLAPIGCPVWGAVYVGLGSIGEGPGAPVPWGMGPNSPEPRACYRANVIAPSVRIVCAAQMDGHPVTPLGRTLPDGGRRPQPVFHTIGILAGGAVVRLRDVSRDIERLGA